MKIVKFKKLADNKYKIYFDDGELKTYDEVIIKNNLLYKKEIDDELYDKIIEENKYYDLYNKCIKLISSKMRSVKEIEKYLIDNEASREYTTNIITKLTNMGLLNDLSYTKAYISDKIHFTNSGPYKIMDELKKNGIDESVIEKEIAKISDEELKNKISKYISSKLRRNNKSAYLFKNKVLEELIDNGYNKDMILEELDKVSVSSNIRDEYDKLYKKLSRKYDDKMLYLHIKNKLYQKGYSQDEILEVIKKVDY